MSAPASVLALADAIVNASTRSNAVAAFVTRTPATGFGAAGSAAVSTTTTAPSEHRACDRRNITPAFPTSPGPCNRRGVVERDHHASRYARGAISYGDEFGTRVPTAPRFSAAPRGARRPRGSMRAPPRAGRTTVSYT